MSWGQKSRSKFTKKQFQDKKHGSASVQKRTAATSMAASCTKDDWTKFDDDKLMEVDFFFSKHFAVREKGRTLFLRCDLASLESKFN